MHTYIELFIRVTKIQFHWNNFEQTDFNSWFEFLIFVINWFIFLFKEDQKKNKFLFSKLIV